MKTIYIPRAWNYSRVMLGPTDPPSASTRQPNASAAAALTAQPTARRGLASSGALCIAQAHAHTRHCILYLFKYNFSFLDQCLTHTPQPGHPPGCAQGQERAHRSSSALTGSYFQAGGFASSRTATLWLCLCLSLQSDTGSDPMSFLPSSAADLLCR